MRMSADQRPSRRWIDITLPVEEGLVVWPGSDGYRHEWRLLQSRGEESNLSVIHTDVHVGTHLEFGRHFLDGGPTLDQVPLEALVGEALVIWLPNVEAVDAADLQRLAWPSSLERLLIRTKNSELWARGVREFRQDFVGLTPAAAAWLVAQRVKLVGLDYLSIARFGQGAETHRTLFRGDCVVLEGLNLDGVAAGRYRLTCLPTRLVGTEAAPARAILEPLTDHDL